MTYDLQGPYSLDIYTVRRLVRRTAPGYYVLGNNRVHTYVGRSDSDLRDRLTYWAGQREEPLFWASYAANAREAYLAECHWFHRLRPRKNQIHPDKPVGVWVTCPRCGR